MRLFLYVEGQEEELFVNRMLRPHLRTFGVSVEKPILAATSFRIGDGNEPDVTVGGVTNYTPIRQDILDFFASGGVRSDDAMTTLIDLYGLPRSFPGYTETLAQRLSGADKASHIEAAWQADLGLANFFPYIQVHEFEALVLTRPSVLTQFYPERSTQIEELRTECAVFPTAEEINESQATSPSHRILSKVPTYRKIDGFRHLQDIGLPEIKVHCPRFATWLGRCEKRFQ